MFSGKEGNENFTGGSTRAPSRRLDWLGESNRGRGEFVLNDNDSQPQINSLFIFVKQIARLRCMLLRRSNFAWSIDVASAAIRAGEFAHLIRPENLTQGRIHAGSHSLHAPADIDGRAAPDTFAHIFMSLKQQVLDVDALLLIA